MSDYCLPLNEQFNYVMSTRYIRWDNDVDDEEDDDDDDDDDDVRFVLD